MTLLHLKVNNCHQTLAWNILYTEDDIWIQTYVFDNLPTEKS